MDGELDITVVLASMREQIGNAAQEKAVLLARITQLEALIKGKDE